MEKIVNRSWLFQRAKCIEKQVLKKYGRSLAAISLLQIYLNKCVVEYRDEYVVINNDMYQEIRRSLLSGDAVPT